MTAPHDDVFEAKRKLSARLLRHPLPARSFSPELALSPEAAVAAALERPDANVHAVGVGRKRVRGRIDPTLCVRLHVFVKLPESRLPANYILPKAVDGVPTDVVESPPALLAQKPDCSAQRQQKQRPVVPGISAADRTGGAGTIGCFCRSRHAGDPPGGVYALSNNHVFANTNQGQIGDPLLQPGPLDGGAAADQFATLSRFVPLVLGGAAANRVDAAIGRLDSGINYQTDICRIGKTAGIASAAEGDPVCKHGRTTGYTEGVVTDVSYDAQVGYPGGQVLFENQIRIQGSNQPIGLQGDSGSLVVRRNDRRAVGLYFANPWDGSYGVANPIADVLNELEIELL